MKNQTPQLQGKIEMIVEYVNNGGGAVQFHKLGELFVSTLDAQSNKSNSITSCVHDLPNEGEEIEMTEALADKVIAEINRK